jgi:hypothetical protein
MLRCHLPAKVGYRTFSLVQYCPNARAGRVAFNNEFFVERRQAQDWS